MINLTLKKWDVKVDDPCHGLDPWTRVNNWAVDELTGAGSRRTAAANTAAAPHAAPTSLTNMALDCCSAG